MTSPTVLFESPRLRATFRPADGGSARPLVVTFDSLNADLRLDRPGFGEGWLTDVGHDAVHVVSSANAWYQHEEMGAACDAIRAVAEAHCWAVTYGSSMGGYAAIRFADRIGARMAVAISPQFSVDPARVAFESRWVEYAQDLTFVWEGTRPTRTPLEIVYVIYDPTDEDRRHAELLAVVYPVTPVRLPYAGHPAGTFLAETDLLSPSVLAMIGGAFDPDRLRAEMRAKRARSGKYHFVLSERQPAWRPRLARRLAERAASLNPQSGAYQSAHARALEAAGELDSAERLRRLAVELAPDEPAFRLPLAALRLRRGAGAEEIEALARGLAALGARRTVYFTRAVELLFLAGAFSAARDEARDASRRLSRSRPLRRWSRALSLALAAPGGRLALEAARRLMMAGRRRRWAARAADR